MAAMRRSPEALDSIKISWRLPSSSAERKLVPVVLPSGRASDFTSPDSTISSVVPRIGIVVVVAHVLHEFPVSPVAKMTSTLRDKVRRNFPKSDQCAVNMAANRIVRFWPSTKAGSPKFIEHRDTTRRTARTPRSSADTR